MTLGKKYPCADVGTGVTQAIECTSDDEAAPGSDVVLVSNSHLRPQSREDRTSDETQEEQADAGFGQEDSNDDDEVSTECYSVPCAQPPRRYESSLCSKDVIPYFLSRTETTLTVDDDGVETRLGRRIQELGEELQLLRDRVQKAEETENELREELAAARAEGKEELEAVRAEGKALREELDAERAARKMCERRVEALESRFDELFNYQQGKKRKRDGDDVPVDSRSVKTRR